MMAKISEGEVLRLRAQTAHQAVPGLLREAGYDRELVISGLASVLVAHIAGRVVESQAGVYGADPVESAKLILDLAMRADVALTAGKVGRS